MILSNPKLTAFVSIVECGTLVAAGAKLGLTQTALTQRVKALEVELEATLFIRSRRGMLLTREGEAILNYCKQAAEIEGMTLANLRGQGMQVNVSLTLSGPSSIISGRIVNQVSKIYLGYPKLNLHLLIDDNTNRINDLKRGSVQLAIVEPSEMVNEVTGKLLKPDQFVLVGHPSWAGRKLPSILQEERIIDFYQEDNTTLNYLKKFGLDDSIGKPRLFVNENNSLISCFCNGVGLGTLTKELAKPYLDRRELIVLNQGKILEVKYALAWYPRKEMPSYLGDIIKAIK